MIFRWKDHKGFLRNEQLMAIIFDLGMVSFRQLCVITGWSQDMVRLSLHQIRKRAGSQEEKGDWIRSYPISEPTKQDTAVYTLGRLGIEYVHEMMQEKQKIKEPPRAQGNHFHGITEILVRLIQSGIDRDQITWLSTVEATDVLYRLWQRSKQEYDRRQFIRPDARLIIDENKRFWIEFDNNTEGPRQLERKFHNYVHTLLPIQETSPIIWVTTTPERSTYLSQIWSQLVRHFYGGQPVPQMHFFSIPDDTKFIIEN